VVGFDATQSFFTFDANTKGLPGTEPYQAATYSWNFGDGTSVSGESSGSVFHTYQYGGTYVVTLTLTDGGGNVAQRTKEVTVDGPPAPSAAKEPASGGSGSGSGSSSAPAAGATPAPPPAASTKPTVPAPVAAAAAVSHSLKTVTRKGLVVRYSVNEQVAGRFEVLLDRATARRLGIGGAPALGLPAGSAPAVVIAKATVITTKGGRSTVSIQFSKRTASRLAR
jgi:PKD domain-containing protein